MHLGSMLLLKTLTLPVLSTVSTQRLMGNQGKMNTFYFPTELVQERLRADLILLKHLVQLMVTAQKH